METNEIKQTVEGAPGALKASNTTKTLKPVDPALASKEAFNAEMARLELEAKQLELRFKKLQYSELQDQIDERESKRVDKGEKARINGSTLRQLAHTDSLVQKRCNHKKGGNGAYGVIAGQGDDNQYAVLKHIMADQSMWIRCLRCAKTWKPPLEEDFETPAGYLGAVAEYQAAVQFQTRNGTSSSVPFKWSDGGAYYRQQLRHTTFR